MSSDLEMAFVDWCNNRRLSSSAITREAFAAGWKARPEPTAYIVPVKLECFPALLKAAKEARRLFEEILDEQNAYRCGCLIYGHCDMDHEPRVRAAVEGMRAAIALAEGQTREEGR